MQSNFATWSKTASLFQNLSVVLGFLTALSGAFGLYAQARKDFYRNQINGQRTLSEARPSIFVGAAHAAERNLLGLKVIVMTAGGGTEASRFADQFVNRLDAAGAQTSSVRIGSMNVMTDGGPVDIPPLSINSHGHDVSRLQRFLAEHGQSAELTSILDVPGSIRAASRDAVVLIVGPHASPLN